MDYLSLLVRTAMVKRDAERRGREQSGSRFIDAVLQVVSKLSPRDWNEIRLRRRKARRRICAGAISDGRPYRHYAVEDFAVSVSGIADSQCSRAAPG